MNNLIKRGTKTVRLNEGADDVIEELKNAFIEFAYSTQK